MNVALSKSNLVLTKSEISSGDPELAAHVEKAPVPPPFPEGGLQAWLTVLGGYVPRLVHMTLSDHLLTPCSIRSMILFCTFGAVQSFGVYQAYYSVSISPRLHAIHHLPSSVALPFAICRE